MNKLNRNARLLMGLAIFATLLPFIFTFSSEGLHFLMLGHFTLIAMACWAIAAAVFTKLFYLYRS